MALVGVAAVTVGLAIWLDRGDGLLGAHVGSIIFAYVVSFLLALVGTYAVVRAAIVESSDSRFRDRFAKHCRFLLVIIAFGSAAGALLGGIWAQRHWGRFWGWDLEEIGALSVVICALLLYLLVTKHRPSSVHLGQASLMMSFVTFIAWFGPVVYEQAVGPFTLALIVVFLIVQLTILSMSLLLHKRKLA